SRRPWRRSSSRQTSTVISCNRSCCGTWSACTRRSDDMGPLLIEQEATREPVESLCFVRCLLFQFSCNHRSAAAIKVPRSRRLCGDSVFRGFFAFFSPELHNVACKIGIGCNRLDPVRVAAITSKGGFRGVPQLLAEPRFSSP